MADRLLELADGSDISDHYDNNRTVQTFHEQEIQQLQEHMTEMQLAEHGSAAVPSIVAAVMEHQRDLVHLQEKEEQSRLHREKKFLQQLERLSKRQPDGDLEQEEVHLATQLLAAVAERMKEAMKDERPYRGWRMNVGDHYDNDEMPKRDIELEREKLFAKCNPIYRIEQQLIRRAIEAGRRHNPRHIASVQPERAGYDFNQIFERETMKEKDECEIDHLKFCWSMVKIAAMEVVEAETGVAATKNSDSDRSWRK